MDYVLGFKRAMHVVHMAWIKWHRKSLPLSSRLNDPARATPKSTVKNMTWKDEAIAMWDKKDEKKLWLKTLDTKGS